MRGLIVLPLWVVLHLGAASLAAENGAPLPPTRERVSAPVVYDGLILVISTKDAVAAVAFGKEIEAGVTYRYRLLLKGEEKSRSGEGKVFEKYVRVPAAGPHGEVLTGVVDRGSQLFIVAGPVRLEWSYSGKGRGWVYYQPEQVRVQIASAREFDKLDLKRFVKRPAEKK